MASGRMFLPKSCAGRLVGGILGQQFLEQARVEDVDAHRGEDRCRAGAGSVSGVGGLLGELGDAVPLGGGEHAEVARLARRHLHHAHGDVGALLHVVGDHRTVVHLVDVIAGEHQHVLGPVREDQLDVLMHGIRGAAIPARADLLLRRDHLDELAELAAQVAPAVLHVLDERLRLVLREDRDLADAGVHAVRQHEIDDAELAAEGRRGLAAVRGEIAQPLAAPAGHDDRERAARQAAHVASGGGACGLARHERYYNPSRTVERNSRARSSSQPFHQAELVRVRQQLVPGVDAHLGAKLSALGRLDIEREDDRAVGVLLVRRA